MIDSHAHYDDKSFDEDRHEILQKCLDEGVTHIVNAGTDVESSRISVSLSERYPFVYAAVGVHPHEASGWNDETLSELKELTGRKKVVAIGEIGLDYHYDFSPREIQKEVFARQIDFARSLKLPIIVHNRESHQDVLDILKSEKAHEVGGVLHCFSGSVETAKQVLDLGFMIGIGGPVTFRKAVRPVEVVRYVPLDMMLVETDCPYLSPEPLRGRRNWSGNLKYIIEKIAQIKGIDFKEAEMATTENAKRLLKL